MTALICPRVCAQPPHRRRLIRAKMTALVCLIARACESTATSIWSTLPSPHRLPLSTAQPPRSSHVSPCPHRQPLSAAQPPRSSNSSPCPHRRQPSYALPPRSMHSHVNATDRHRRHMPMFHVHDVRHRRQLSSALPPRLPVRRRRRMSMIHVKPPRVAVWQHSYSQGHPTSRRMLQRQSPSPRERCWSAS
jgi:hypothetical protein